MSAVTLEMLWAEFEAARFRYCHMSKRRMRLYASAGPELFVKFNGRAGRTARAVIEAAKRLLAFSPPHADIDPR